MLLASSHALLFARSAFLPPASSQIVKA